MVKRAQSTYSPEQLPGHTLCDVNGHEVGLIMGIGPTYVDVGTGILHLGDGLFVPFAAIAYCTDSRCYLRIPSDQLGMQGWNERPEQHPSTHAAGPEPQPSTIRIPYRPEEPEQRQAGA